MPQRHVFQGGDRVAPQHAGEAGEPFPRDGIALVRHGAGTLLPLGERFLGFEHFRALQMAELDGPTFNAGADQRERGLKFRMDVALHHLRGNGCRAHAQLFANIRFHARREMRAGANRTGNLAYGHHFANAFETFERPPEFVMHQRQF